MNPANPWKQGLPQKNTVPGISSKDSISSERAGIRTPDNLIKSQVLYHLSYTPIINWASWIRTNEMQESKSCALPLGDSPLIKEKGG